MVFPLIPRKELITVKTIRTMGGKEKIKTEISKPSRFKKESRLRDSFSLFKAILVKYYI